MVNFSPKRPVVLRFRFGQGLVKARKDSEDTARAIVQQVAIDFTEKTFDEAKRNFARRIEADVRAELIHLQALYRKYIIGAAGRNNRPQGTLDTVSKGAGAPRASLSGMLPTWAPRGATYLADKKSFIGNTGWFDNTGWFMRGYEGGYLRDAFAPIEMSGRVGGGGVFAGADTQTMFEDMFGPISVQILRNRRGTGIFAGTLTGPATGRRRKVQTQLATIRVRALGSLTPSDTNAFGGYNHSLMDKVRAYDPQLAFRLGGRATHYRPTLEPFLKFYLDRAIPQAVNARISKGELARTLFRN